MKYLVCYDKSAASVKAMKTAAKRARETGAFVYLVMSAASDITNEETARLENELKVNAEEIFRGNGIDCEFHLLVRGLTPGEDIIKFAKEKDIDEIIIGIKKRSKVGKLLFGSTAQLVILEAHCPVLSVLETINISL